MARCLYASSTPYFWRYNPRTNIWDSMDTSGLPTGAFRTGTALTWDYNDSIYALGGGRYSDSNRRDFYRYSISNNRWEELTNSPHAQGAGDALTWSGYDDQIYALLGSRKHKTDFACYNISTNSWDTLPFNPNWTTTDDGASLVWAGGEYLYALRGEWQEKVPCVDYARYNLPTKTWEDMASIPEIEGVGDGGSLLWSGDYPDYIFALGGGSCLEDPGYNFYRYKISQDKWEQLESIPCPVGYYVGNRLGFANGHIYYWQGSPKTEKWICGGDAFYMFEFGEEPAEPAISIQIDKREYSPGETMTVTLGFKNPTASSVKANFIWYLDWLPISVTPLTLPPKCEQSYEFSIPVGEWSPVGFEAAWYVALLEQAAPHETICEDSAAWRFVPTAATTATKTTAATTTQTQVPKEVAEQIARELEVEREEFAAA